MAAGLFRTSLSLSIVRGYDVLAAYFLSLESITLKGTWSHPGVSNMTIQSVTILIVPVDIMQHGPSRLCPSP